MKKLADRAFVLILSLVLLAVPILTAARSRHNTTSYYENRTLAPLPAFSTRALLDGSYLEDLESWYADHLPGRTTVMKLSTKLQQDVLRRPVVNDTVVSEAVLLPLLDYHQWPRESFEENAQRIAEKYRKLSDFAASVGSAFYFVGLPEQRVYFEELYPAYLCSHKDETQAADSLFYQALSAQGVAYLDMEAVYDRQGRPAAYYSAVDHHYTYYGAYAAYRSIMDLLARDGWALPVLGEEDLEFQALPNPYIGSRNRKLYNLWPNSEQAVIARQKEEVPFRRWDNGEESAKPLFVLPDEAALPTTYNLYMGGDFAETVLMTHRPDLPDVLIFGDSFTNALETLLYASFDETRILDLRHYTQKSLRAYIEDYRPDIVLSIQNDTFFYTTTGNGNIWEE